MTAIDYPTADDMAVRPDGRGMAPERRHRLLRLARRRGDKAAVAILEADRRYSPEPAYPMFVARVTRSAA